MYADFTAVNTLPGRLLSPTLYISFATKLDTHSLYTLLLGAKPHAIITASAGISSDNISDLILGARGLLIFSGNIGCHVLYGFGTVLDTFLFITTLLSSISLTADRLCATTPFFSK